MSLCSGIVSRLRRYPKTSQGRAGTRSKGADGGKYAASPTWPIRSTTVDGTFARLHRLVAELKAFANKPESEEAIEDNPKILALLSEIDRTLTDLESEDLNLLSVCDGPPAIERGTDE